MNYLNRELFQRLLRNQTSPGEGDYSGKQDLKLRVAWGGGTDLIYEKKNTIFGVMTTYEQDQPINKKTEMTLSQLLLFFDKAIITIGFLKLKN